MHERATTLVQGVLQPFWHCPLPSVAGAQVLGTVAVNVKDASGAVLPV
jgi:hypothetical protein